MRRDISTLLIALVACKAAPSTTRDGAAPDAPSGISYSIAVEHEGSAAAVPPTIYIDDVATTSATFQYASSADAEGQVHTIELRFGSATIRSYVRTLGSDPGLELSCGSGSMLPIAMLHEDLCEYDSGDIRYGDESARTGSCDLEGDGFCSPECYPTTCPSGQRCTREVTSIEPPASYLTCGPIGSAAIGSACTIGNEFDDCGSDGLCVGDTCVALCDPQTPPEGCTCSNVPGVPPELMICA
jgi:hypothetical protein